MSLAIFCIAYYLSAGVGVGLGLHRGLSHRAFRLPLWLERAIITLSLPAGTPVQWAGNHRFHHAHADVADDPHSPNVSGFWYAHAGWYLGTKNPLICLLYSFAGPARMAFDAFWRPRTNQQFNALAADVASDPYYAWVSRPGPYLLMMLLHIGLAAAFVFHIAGAAGIAIWWLELVIIYNFSEAIDSVAHLWGGAKHGLLPRQFDWTWQLIRGLRYVGLANDVKVPDERAVLRKVVPQ
jgi:stearoyl-CoA desaturase (delta-9 desaturase)